MIHRHINTHTDTHTERQPKIFYFIHCNLTYHTINPLSKFQQKGITITPIPGFTVKTKATPSGSKVFINLCTHEEIDAPSVKKKLNDKGESVEGKIHEYFFNSSSLYYYFSPFLVAICT